MFLKLRYAPQTRFKSSNVIIQIVVIVSPPTLIDSFKSSNVIIQILEISIMLEKIISVLNHLMLLFKLW